ncbi:hypothetical protein K488DRAFT_89227 [Vararia minispora EC-137]|uniref:Uncharacterized protein n=1 Tax=Vararia minispora EC-137 TaxID=1314806 RepID=A0ACB8QB54_9AGAM|nr:hypothetical protein K488DRAFT_89227 [Vararia minispora EC-137]
MGLGLLSSYAEYLSNPISSDDGWYDLDCGIPDLGAQALALEQWLHFCDRLPVEGPSNDYQAPSEWNSMDVTSDAQVSDDASPTGWRMLFRSWGVDDPPWDVDLDIAHTVSLFELHQAVYPLGGFGGVPGAQGWQMVWSALWVKSDGRHFELSPSKPHPYPPFATLQAAERIARVYELRLQMFDHLFTQHMRMVALDAYHSFSDREQDTELTDMHPDFVRVLAVCAEERPWEMHLQGWHPFLGALVRRHEEALLEMRARLASELWVTGSLRCVFCDTDPYVDLFPGGRANTKEAPANARLEWCEVAGTSLLGLRKILTGPKMSKDREAAYRRRVNQLECEFRIRLEELRAAYIDCEPQKLSPRLHTDLESDPVQYHELLGQVMELGDTIFKMLPKFRCAREVKTGKINDFCQILAALEYQRSLLNDSNKDPVLTMSTLGKLKREWASMRSSP